MNFFTQIIMLTPLFLFILMALQRKQLLSALLTLEMIMIMILFILILVMSKTFMDIFSMLTILTFAATEASLGLATLVMMMRSYGTDAMSLSLMTC